MLLKSEEYQGTHVNKVHIRKFFEDELIFAKKNIPRLKRVDILC
jgi:hypothetical protein